MLLGGGSIFVTKSDHSTMYIEKMNLVMVSILQKHFLYFLLPMELRSDFMPGSRVLKTQILNARHSKNDSYSCRVPEI